MITFKFDASCVYWTDNFEYNKIFLTHQAKYLKTRLANRGYLYLNEVYECFGLNWDPDHSNLCYREELSIEFIHLEDADYLIVIHRP